VMTEREATGTVVVSRGGDLVTAGHRKGADTLCAQRSKRLRVVVPSAEDRLEKDRKDAEECGCPARSPARRPDPQPRGETKTLAYFTSPSYPAPMRP